MFVHFHADTFKNIILIIDIQCFIFILDCILFVFGLDVFLFVVLFPFVIYIFSGSVVRVAPFKRFKPLL